MGIDRKRFFDGIRSGPFPGKLTNAEVNGISAILNAWEKDIPDPDPSLTDKRELAYMLATVYVETNVGAGHMLPIIEYGGANPRRYFRKYDAGTRIGKRLGNTKKGDGYRYRGRGLVQLTGRSNYAKMGNLLKIDLVDYPDLALDPEHAAKIMLIGMRRGSFTGKKLSHYFSDSKADWINARRIINGLDRAKEIAGIAKQFYADILGAS